MLGTVHHELTASLDRQMPSELLWCGHVVKAIDGTSAQLPDTVENQLEFPQQSGQKPGCGFPVMQLSGLLNLCHGGWEQFVTSDINYHDHKLLDVMLPHVGRDEVLVADRAYCSYEMFARLADQGSWMLARLHQKRKVDWRKGKKLGRDERIVTWQRSSRPRGSNLEKKSQAPEKKSQARKRK
jgi:hypothetical protein